MIVLQAEGLEVFYGEQKVLDNISFAVNEKERIGLVGVNGSGKTTLLKCLTRQIEPDKGEMYISSLISWGYLEQLPDYSNDKTVWNVVMDSFAKLLELRQVLRELEEKMAAAAEDDLAKLMDKYAIITEEYERNNGYACETLARKILIGLGFSEDEFIRPVSSFSGGQKTRLNLARLLTLEPDILFLDEPTNHLDIGAVEWLEDYLLAYRGTLIVVSHDRVFLDKIATRIFELNFTQLYSYPGNFSNYLKLKALNSKAEEKAYQKQQEYIQKTEAYINRFKAGIKAKQAHGRQQQLDRLERIARREPETAIASWNFKLKQESAVDVLKLENAAKSYKEVLFHHINIHVRKGDKIAVIGPNGCGKTTLLKIILGVINPEKGSVNLGSRVVTGYFSQEFEDMDETKSILHEILYNFDLTIEQTRTLLGRMLFSGDDVFKKVGSLSGGEKARLAILKLLLTGANFLILDEPTNHLDIESRLIVEDMLKSYPGTILMVSHDRYFIDQVATQILAFEGGTVKHYLGNYSFYQSKKTAGLNKIASPEAKVSSQQLRRIEEKEKLKEERKLKRGLSKLEEEIEHKEKQIREIEGIIADPEHYADVKKVMFLSKELEQLEDEVAELYKEWEELVGKA